MVDKREIDLEEQALRLRALRIIQRLMRGKAGRIKFQYRVWEVETAEMRFRRAIDCQRVFRGHQGRHKAEARRRELFRILRNKSATLIQKIFRGGRGRIIAAITKALTELREKNQWYAREIQRVIRGALGRMHLGSEKEERERIKRVNLAACLVQRIFRGHKGKEVSEIEADLQLMEKLAAPLFIRLKDQEKEYEKEARLLRQLQFKDELREQNLRDCEKELLHCMMTNAKFTDCDKITGVPQRFLTKYLRVRLKDYYDHEELMYKEKRTELKRQTAKTNRLEEAVAHTRRELVPLTTGLVSRVKKNRSARLRKLVRDKYKAATMMNSLARRALVRITYNEPDRDYWIECMDEQQGEEPYYYNTLTEVTSWKQPRAFKLFIRKGPGDEDSVVF
jgi:hypothetical protein